MTALDQAIVVKKETTWGTAATLSTGARAFEFNSEGIEESYGRTEGDPLRVATFTKRNDRFTPYFSGAAGSLELDVMTKGFGFFLEHMMGQVATTGPTETSVYTHTGTNADLLGKGITMQVQRPFHPTGTAQAFTYEGGKVADWELSNSVDGNLVCALGLDFQQVATATALQDPTALYPTTMENLTWAGGVITIAGSSYPVSEISIKQDNGLNVDRRYINGSTDKQEQTGGRREVTWSLAADFESLTQRNRAAGATRAASLAAITATWTGPTILGTTIYPSLQASIPAARFDTWKAADESPEGISQELSGVGLFDGTNSTVSLVYKSADVTP